MNQIVIDSTVPTRFLISAAAGSSTVLAGSDPLIEMRGRATTIVSPLQLNSSSGTVTVRNEGYEDLLLSGVISEAVPGQSLTIDATPTGAHPRSIILNGPNSFTGGVTLLGGHLVAGWSAAFGTGTLTAKGGTLQLSSAFRLPTAVALDGTLTLTGAEGAELAGVISGGNASAGLVLRNNDATLVLTGSSTYTGATIVDYTPVSDSTFTGGTLRITGDGSISTSSAIDVRAGGTMQIDAKAGVTNRLGDATPVILRDGKLVFQGIAAVDAQTETIGALQSSGYSRVTIAPVVGGGSLRLTAAALERVDRGTFQFLGQGLGGEFSSGSANLLLSSAPAGLVGGGGQGAQSSILPYAIGAATNASNGASFVTWNAETGIRPLNLTTEYVNSLSGAAQNSNVRLTTTLTHTASTTINSLVLAGGSISGGGALTIASGGILHSSSLTTGISNTLNFGTAEANIFTSYSLFLHGAISGENGLTKSGAGTLTINGNNTISGPLTINDGIVAFPSAARLGPGTSPIVLGGTDAGLSYIGTTPLTLTRPIHLQTGTGRMIVGSTSGPVALAGAISGAGGLMISSTSNSLRTVALAGTNTYSGPTRVNEFVNLEVASDVALGQGGALELASRSKLTLAGDWQTSRLVALVPSTPMRDAVKFDTAQYTATLHGPLTGSREGLEKLGTGTLRLAGDARTLRGTVALRGGGIELSGLGATNVERWNLSSGTRLVIDNTDVPMSYRGGFNFPLMQLEGATYELRGNADVPVVEQIGPVGMRGTSVIRIAPTGTAAAVARISTLYHMSPETFTSMPEPGTELLIRANNLGGGPEGAFSRITANSISSRSGSPDAYGFVPNVYLADPLGGQVTSLAFYDKTTDSAGEIGFRPLRSDEYASGLIANPQNGGATSAAAHVLAIGELSALGGSNTVASVTIQPGGKLLLSGEQKLTVASGTLLALPGGAESSISGGTLDLGMHRSAIYTAGNLEISSDVIGSGTLVKAGPGILALAGSVTSKGGIEVDRGSLHLREGADVGLVLVNGDALLKLEADSSAGALTGKGTVALGAHRLSIGGIAGSYEFSGPITGTGGLTIEGPTTGIQTHHLSAVNPFSGGIRLESGRLSWETSDALGTGTITAVGGALYADKPRTLVNPILTEADLRVEGNGEVTLAPAAVVSGVHGIEVHGAGGLEIQSNSAFTGEARSVFVPSAYAYETLGTLTVSGPAGSIAASSRIRIGPDGALVLDNTSPFAGPAIGRVGNETPVHLQSAELKLIGATIPERIGSLMAGGFSTVTGQVRLEVEKLERVARGSFFFRGVSGSLTAAQAPTDLIGGGGIGTSVSILPYAVGTLLGDGSVGFVTYDPVRGIRQLDPETEYASTLALAGSSDNVRLTLDTTTNEAAIVVNSLVLDARNPQTLGGAGSIQLNSGALLKAGASDSVIWGDLRFASVEANIFVSDPDEVVRPSTLTVNGVISGTGGLTKSGDGDLVLTGENTFTGPLTINSGILQFHSQAALGAATTPIVVMGRSAGSGLRYGGTSPGTLDRDVIVNEGMVDLSTRADLQMTGAISGMGGVLISRYAHSDPLSGFVSLNSANTYNGPTIVNGRLRLGADSELGDAGSVMNGGLIRLSAPWITSREFIGVGGELDTNGYQAALNGPVSGQFTKIGSGILTLEANDAFTGFVVVNEGFLDINGDVGPSGTLTAGLAGTIRGAGRFGGDIRLGGTLSPGKDGPGTLELETLTLLSGATLSLELASATQFDRIVTEKTLIAPGAGTLGLSLSLNYDPLDFVDSFRVIEHPGSYIMSTLLRVSYDGRVLNEGDEFFAGPQLFSISYLGGTGNDVVLSAIPEPASAALLACGGLLLLRRRRVL